MNDFIYIFKLMSNYFLDNNKLKFSLFLFITVIYYFFETFGFLNFINYLSKTNNIIPKKKYLLYFSIFLVLFLILNYLNFKLLNEILDEQIAPSRKKLINSLYKYINNNFKNFKIGNTIIKLYNITWYYVGLSIKIFNGLLPSSIIITLLFLDLKIPLNNIIIFCIPRDKLYPSKFTFS